MWDVPTMENLFNGNKGPGLKYTCRKTTKKNRAYKVHLLHKIPNELIKNVLSSDMCE
jgi:hypothetical protein